jgi:hypothetical protein
MKAALHGWWLCMVFAALLVTPTLAQTADEQPAKGREEPTSPVHQESPLFASDYKPLLMYGASATVDSVFPSSSSSSQFYTLLRSSFAVDVPIGRFRMVLRSSPLVGYQHPGDSTLSANGFVDPSFDAGINLTHRVKLYFSGGVQYGSEVIRLFGQSSQDCGTLCPVSLSSGLKPGALPGALPSPDAAVVSSLTRNVLEGYGLSSLRWSLTRRQEVVFTTSHAYTSSESYSANVTSGRVGLNYDLTPLSTLTSYAQVHHEFSDAFECVSYGTGLGFTQHLWHGTEWSAEAGPEFGSRGCRQRVAANFAGYFRQALPLKSTLYLGATRTQDTFYLAGSRWVDTARAGLRTKSSVNSSVELQGSFVRNAWSNGATLSYSGFLISPEFRWKAGKDTQVTVAYGHFHRTEVAGGINTPKLNRDWITLMLTWSPSPIPF